MYSSMRKWCLGSVAALALTATSTSTYAVELSENLGPVGPNEPILTTVGSKRIIAFYETSGDNCGMHIVIWDRADVGAGSAARFRVTLNPRQMVHVDSADNKSLDLQCGEQAENLAIVDTSKFVSAGAAQ
jgi:hypothetical protein